MYPIVLACLAAIVNVALVVSLFFLVPAPTIIHRKAACGINKWQQFVSSQEALRHPAPVSPLDLLLLVLLLALLLLQTVPSCRALLSAL